MRNNRSKHEVTLGEPVSHFFRTAHFESGRTNNYEAPRKGAMNVDEIPPQDHCVKRLREFICTVSIASRCAIADCFRTQGGVSAYAKAFLRWTKTI